MAFGEGPPNGDEDQSFVGNGAIEVGRMTLGYALDPAAGTIPFYTQEGLDIYQAIAVLTITLDRFKALAAACWETGPPGDGPPEEPDGTD